MPRKIRTTTLTQSVTAHNPVDFNINRPRSEAAIRAGFLTYPALAPAFPAAEATSGFIVTGGRLQALRIAPAGNYSSGYCCGFSPHSLVAHGRPIKVAGRSLPKDYRPQN